MSVTIEDHVRVAKLKEYAQRANELEQKDNYTDASNVYRDCILILRSIVSRVKKADVKLTFLDKLQQYQYKYTELRQIAQDKHLHEQTLKLAELKTKPQVPKTISNGSDSKGDDDINVFKQFLKRECITTPEPVAWRQIIGLKEQKRELSKATDLILTFSSLMDGTHYTAPKGVLLYGPPGTGNNKEKQISA